MTVNKLIEFDITNQYQRAIYDAAFDLLQKSNKVTRKDLRREFDGNDFDEILVDAKFSGDKQLAIDNIIEGAFETLANSFEGKVYFRKTSCEKIKPDAQSHHGAICSKYQFRNYTGRRVCDNKAYNNSCQEIYLEKIAPLL